MKYAYIQNTEIPGLRAHASFVVKTAEAAAQNGHKVWLILPKRVVTEWNRSESIWDYYHVAKKSISIIYVSGLRYWIIAAWFRLTHNYVFPLDTLWFAYNAWCKAKALGIEIIQTSDVEVIAVFSLLKQLYKPKLIFDIHNRLPNWLTPARLEAVDVYVSNSVGLREDIISKGASPEKTIILPNGYDPLLFSKKSKSIDRSSYGLEKSDFVIGFIGRFSTFGEEKGITDLMYAAADISRDIPVKVLLVGGPEDLARQYSELAQSLGIKDKAIIRPAVPPKDVSAIIKLFDIAWLVYPNTPRYRNRISPMKAIEYAAAKVPIIASDLPSIHHIFEHTAVYFINPKSREQMKSAIKHIYENREEARQKVTIAHNTITQFSWKKRQQVILKKLGV